MKVIYIHGTKTVVEYSAYGAQVVSLVLPREGEEVLSDNTLYVVKKIRYNLDKKHVTITLVGKYEV